MDKKTKDLVILSMFASIVLLLAFTPIGYLQLPFIKATIVHIPVIIGSIMLGPKYGAILGFLFGFTSFINNTITPAVSSFVFTPLLPVPGSAAASGSLWALAVCFLPRVLVGILPWLVYKSFCKLTKNKFTTIGFTIAGAVGSFTNTILVMHLILFFFKDAYASVRNIEADAIYAFILSIIAANGIPEAIASIIIVTSVCKTMQIVFKKSGAV